MKGDRFTVVTRGRLARIRFDDGGMNLLSAPALAELERVLIHLPDKAEILVFESGDASIFAAGADMDEMSRFSALDAVAFAALGQRVFATIERLPMVTVAMIDGECFGGALDLVLAFDYRVATTRSRFSHPGGRIGIVTGFGGTSRWRRVLGHSTARGLFVGNRVLSASDAAVAGLVDRLVDDAGSVTDGDLLLLDARSGDEIEMVKSLALSDCRDAASLLGLARRLATVYALTSRD